MGGELMSQPDERHKLAADDLQHKWRHQDGFEIK